MSFKLYRVLLPVQDIEAAARFYGEVLQMTGVRVSPGRHYFDCGGTILACFDPHADGDGYTASSNPEHIYLSTEDLESTLERIKKHPQATIEKDIQTYPWGERSFYINDPFGNPICFVEEKTTFTGR